MKQIIDVVLYCLSQATTDEVLYNHWYKLVKFRFLLEKAAHDSTVIVHLSTPQGPTYRLIVTSAGVAFMTYH